MQLLMDINFSENCFCCIPYVSFIAKHFISPLISSLIHWLYRSVVINFYISMPSPVFLLLMISSFTPLKSYEVSYITAIFLNWLSLLLGAVIRTSLKNDSCVLEENVFFAADEGNFLFVSVRFIWSKIWFKSNVFLVDFLPRWSIYLLLKVEYWSYLFSISLIYKLILLLLLLLLLIHIMDITVLVIENKLWDFYH